MYSRVVKLAHTYKDLDFNFYSHPVTGDVSVRTDAADVSQSIRNLVQTHFYERGFNVDVGSSVGRMLFDNFTPLMVHEIGAEIRTLIDNFEPRADIDDVIVTFDNHYLYIEIKFNILNSERIQGLQIKLKVNG
jgi:phage baseplate assembly protein W